MESATTIGIVNFMAVWLMMTVGWVFSVKKENVTIVDSLWGLGFVLIALITYHAGSGYEGRRILVLMLTAIWGLRLAAHLTLRNWGQGEDHRYGQWRRNSGRNFWWISLFKVFWLQTVFLWVISLVLQKALLSEQPDSFTFFDLVGTLLWSAGMLFESIGDWQLAKFKADPDNQGKVLDKGLWAWTRHPNYFGEFLVWWGFFFVSLSTPGGWMTILCPAIVTIVLLKLTGVPLTENALKKRRPDYAEYVRRTAKFFPRPPLNSKM